MLRIDFKEFARYRKRVRDKWLSKADDLWWGDRLDSRFIAGYYLKTFRHKRIFDLGCNAGVILSELDPTNYRVGMDLFEKPLQLAKKMTGDEAYLIQGDIRRLPIKKNSFDIIVLFGMLEVIDNAGKITYFNYINDILRSGGELVITAQNRSYLSIDDKKNFIDYKTLCSLLCKGYELTVYGFNPFPGFPFFFPNKILARAPFIWRILIFLARKGILLKYCRSFIVIAKKL